MKKYLNNLREKEQHEKDRIAFIGAFTITLFIVLFWLAGVSALNNEPAQNQSANVSSPLSIFTEIFSSFKK